MLAALYDQNKKIINTKITSGISEKISFGIMLVIPKEVKLN
jgi:hypothetical protein